uniref:Transposase n=1 Tax=Steinernema glaseri TaxID=37863 RepID=A0A1I7ZW59_9BILA
MSFSSSYKVVACANAQKPTMDAKKEQKEAIKALIDENRQLRKELERLKEIQKRMDLRKEAIVCHLLQRAKEHHGPDAVKWTSIVTGIGAQTLSEYEKKSRR